MVAGPDLAIRHTEAVGDLADAASVKPSQSVTLVVARRHMLAELIQGALHCLLNCLTFECLFRPKLTAGQLIGFVSAECFHGAGLAASAAVGQAVLRNYRDPIFESASIRVEAEACEPGDECQPKILRRVFAVLRRDVVRADQPREHRRVGLHEILAVFDWARVIQVEAPCPLVVARCSSSQAAASPVREPQNLLPGGDRFLQPTAFLQRVTKVEVRFRRVCTVHE